MKKQKRKMKMQVAEEERDYMQEWKERGRLKPFTEEGVEEAQYVSKYLNQPNDEQKTLLWGRFIEAVKSLVSKLKIGLMKWM